ncbi:coatomer subunit gamma-2-like [Salvia splendens]|uniref:coatomer subunit gamma-2-like n=1 Tax=Salvia splendens TaxID=180675 RepID=UPI001C26FC5C|nr:coatomer subunit gamma-2-like [Salvia splendens]
MQWQCVKRDHDLSTNKDCSWFVVIEKHAVLTEVRGFSDPHIDKTRCLKIIKRLLYLLNQGEIFTKARSAKKLQTWRFSGQRQMLESGILVGGWIRRDCLAF